MAMQVQAYTYTYICASSGSSGMFEKVLVLVFLFGLDAELVQPFV